MGIIFVQAYSGDSMRLPGQIQIVTTTIYIYQFKADIQRNQRNTTQSHSKFCPQHSVVVAVAPGRTNLDSR